MVAPITAAKPVLDFAINWMSVAVLRKLMADVLGRDWMLPAEDGVGLRAADRLTELRDGSIGSLALGDTFGPNMGSFQGREARHR
jgi:hypothetical protein